MSDRQGVLVMRMYGGHWCSLATARRWLLCLAVVLVTPALALGLHLGALRLTTNFHEVESQLLYRSAQLEGEALRSAIQRYRLRSVLSLRGGSPGDRWFDEETATLRGLGIPYHQVKISAHRLIAPERLDEIVRIMREAPKPLLVHCNAGSDRTGLAMAAYALRQGVPLATAQAQLSLRYGHVPWLISASSAMDQSLLVYERYLQRRPLAPLAALP